MPAARGFPVGFSKTVLRVLFALAARLPSATNSAASQTLSRNRPGPFWSPMPRALGCELHGCIDSSLSRVAPVSSPGGFHSQPAIYPPS
jgi:hypothetical protein